MVPALFFNFLVVAGITLNATAQLAETATLVESDYFEGRWAFAEEACDVPTNWTLLAGGNFVSEDLTGTWEWDGDKLALNLTDLAIDEETGELGGRFQMEGPVMISDADQFTFTIAPDIYIMKRCG